ncbi:MAG TPA: barstar family protein [Pseudonocardiaceae bacterium]
MTRDTEGDVNGERAVRASQAAEEARRRGAEPHLVDGTALRSKRDALDAIARALSFPSYFGHNLDALYDSLTDLSWLPDTEHVLIWSHHRVLAQHDPAAYQGIRAVLDDAVAEAGRHGRRLTVVLTDD